MAAPGPADVDAYLAAQPEPARAALSRIRGLVRSAAPHGVETIKYGMPTVVLEGRHAVYFAGWKRHVGFYAVYPGSELDPELAPYRHGADTVRFPLGEELPWPLVERLVALLTR